MRLEVETIKVNELIEGPETKIDGKDIHISIEQLKKHLMDADDRILDLTIKVIPHHNDDTRIVDITDVIQPRCKVGEGVNFPGWIDDIETAGSGVTRALENVVVVVANSDAKFHYNTVLDTGGELAEVSRYANQNILFLDGETKECTMNEKDEILKTAGLRAAVLLAEMAEAMDVDDTELFDLELHNQDNPDNLPRVAYYCQIHAAHYDDDSIPPKILYGQTTLNMMPSIVHPNEIMDGGLVGVHNISFKTYNLQNHALIRELYKRHQNKELIFTGVIIGVLALDDARRDFFAKHGVKLMKEQMNADGVILTKYQGGAPHLDQALMAIECEKAGIKSCPVITPFTYEGTLEENLVYVDEALDLMIANFIYLGPLMSTFKPKTLLGGPKDGSKWDYMERLVGDTHVNGVELYTDDHLIATASLIEGFPESFGAASMKATNY